MKDIHDVIKHAKFGDDRLRGSGVVAGQTSAFPIDFAGRPYNTLTLPCERVIRRHALVLDNCTVDAQKCFCSVYDLIFDWFAACRLMSISQHCETGACVSLLAFSVAR